MVLPPDEFDVGEQPHCPMCGTVMHDADGGYECRGCGYFHPVAWVERPDDGDDVPAIRGG